MLKIYGEEHNLKIDDHIDLDEVIEAMEKLDNVYKQRSQLNEKLILVDKTILFYAFCFNIKNINDDTLSLIKIVIKNWKKFSSDEQQFIEKKLIKKIKKNKISDYEIQSWVKSKNKL